MSQGRDAAAGSSLRLLSARIAANAASGKGWMQASVPPTTTTSARPLRIICRPCATASAPEAHADTGVWTPARAESSRPTTAAGPLGISIGMVCGLTRRGPGLAVDVPLAEQGERATDAGGDADRRAARGSTSGVPASAHASRAAIERELLGAVELARLDPVEHVSRVDRHATRRTCTGSSDAHSSVRERTPERPASSPSQVDATSPPTGVVAPRPVTTTVCASDLGVLVIGQAPACAM